MSSSGIEFVPDTGIPHFKGIVKMARASGYTFDKAINDIIDNVIFKTNKLIMNLQFDSETNNLYSIEFTDDYEHGFEHIYEEGDKNPFNMYHVKTGHSNDDETSEFGMGLKWASIFLGNELIVYTRTNKNKNQFIEIVYNFVEMMNKQDPKNSFKPQRWNYIDESEYLRNHRNLTHGSTIIIKGIHQNTYTKSHTVDCSTPDFIIGNIKKNISNTFGKIIKKRVMDIQIWNGGLNTGINFFKNIDIFDHPQTSIFKTHTTINIKNFGSVDDGFLAYSKTREYNGKISYNRLNSSTIIKGSSIKTDVYENNFDQINDTILEFTSTNIYFMYPTKEEREHHCMFGDVHVFRMNRKYDQTNFNGRKRNGSQNYTYHQLDYTSKHVNKKTRFMNYNKTVNRDLNNTFIDMLSCIQRLHETKYNTDVSTKVFKSMEDFAKSKGIVLPDPTPPVDQVPVPVPVLVPVPVPVPPKPHTPEPNIKYFLQGPSVYFINKKDKRTDNKYLLLEDERIQSKFGITDNSPTKRMESYKEYELQYFEELRCDDKGGIESVRTSKKQFKALVEEELYEEMSKIESVKFEKKSCEIFTYLPIDRFSVRDTFLCVVKQHRP
jgi:hypothetical protein